MIPMRMTEPNRIQAIDRLDPRRRKRRTGAAIHEQAIFAVIKDVGVSFVSLDTRQWGDIHFHLYDLRLTCPTYRVHSNCE